MYSPTKLAVLLAVLCGVSSAAPLTGGKQGLRSEAAERRSLKTTSTVYCNSIGCPNGYIPITDASSTKCTNGVCTTEQCCDAFCWGFACTAGGPNYANINEECPDTGCTAELCCLEPVLYCNAIGCPNGYIPISDASTTTCTDGICTTEQCCNAFCWGYACPNGYIPNYKTINDECPTSGCTRKQCCTKG